MNELETFLEAVAEAREMGIEITGTYGATHIEEEQAPGGKIIDITHNEGEL